MLLVRLTRAGEKAMAAVTAGFGLLLVVLGLGGYFGTMRVSKTALIPAFFGLPILILGLLALADVAPRPVIIAATVLAVLGFCGAARGLPKLVKMLSGATIVRPVAAIMQSVMAALCLGYAAWAIGWLITTG
jgi:hypothetical protein